MTSVAGFFTCTFFFSVFFSLLLFLIVIFHINKQKFDGRMVGLTFSPTIPRYGKKRTGVDFSAFPRNSNNKLYDGRGNKQSFK